MRRTKSKLDRLSKAITKEDKKTYIFFEELTAEGDPRIWSHEGKLYTEEELEAYKKTLPEPTKIITVNWI